MLKLAKLIFKVMAKKKYEAHDEDDDYEEEFEETEDGIMDSLFPDEESEEGFDIDDHFGLND